jgi:hypothetical protein
MRSTALPPVVLARFGLLAHGKPLPPTVRHLPEPGSGPAQGPRPAV